LADLPDYQALFLHEIVRGLAELLDHTHDLAGNIDTLHGLTTRIEALRDDLGDELPPDPRVLPFKGRGSGRRGGPGKNL
jgi:hypothetical protein